MKPSTDKVNFVLSITYSLFACLDVVKSAEHI